MRRSLRFVMLMLLALTACDPTPKHDAASSGVAEPPPPAGYADGLAAGTAAAKPAESAKLAYRHQLDLEMAPNRVEPRFERARDACLKNTELGCVLLNAGIRSGNGYPQADLTVRLPHGQVETFEQSVMAPLPGETPGEDEVILRSTTAEDLTQALLDGDRRLSELTLYRDRLIDLAKHTDAKVEDLIKVESELATTQSQIETLVAQQQRLNERVATEQLTVELSSRRTIGAAENPIARVWHESAGILSDNIADALRVVIAVLPWLVPLFLLLQLLRLLWRFLRRRR